MVKSYLRAAVCAAPFVLPLGCMTPSGGYRNPTTEASAARNNAANERLMRIAATLEKHGRNEKALEFYAAVVSRNPDNVEAAQRLELLAAKEKGEYFGGTETQLAQADAPAHSAVDLNLKPQAAREPAPARHAPALAQSQRPVTPSAPSHVKFAAPVPAAPAIAARQTQPTAPAATPQAERVTKTNDAPQPAAAPSLAASGPLPHLDFTADELSGGAGSVETAEAETETGNPFAATASAVESAGTAAPRLDEFASVTPKSSPLTGTTPQIEPDPAIEAAPAAAEAALKERDELARAEQDLAAAQRELAEFEAKQRLDEQPAAVQDAPAETVPPEIVPIQTATAQTATAQSGTVQAATVAPQTPPQPIERRADDAAPEIEPAVRPVPSSMSLVQLCPRARGDVWSLVSQLEDERPVIRKEAAARLARMGSAAEAALPALLQTTVDSDPYVRGHSALALWKIEKGADVAVPVLCDLLTDSDPQVRGLAAYVLGSIGRSAHSALPVLHAAARDSDPLARVHVNEALATIDPTCEPAIDALIEALHSKDTEVQTLAAYALANVASADPDRVLRELIAALRGNDANLRWAAAMSLGAFGATAREAIPELVNAAKNPNDANLREAATIALTLIDPKQ